MKIGFDKFNLNQKLYSVIGAVIAILTYMVDADNLNVAIGIALLTIILVLMLKNQYISYCPRHPYPYLPRSID